MSEITVNNIAFLKNSRTYGADGLLLKALVEDGEEWKIYAFDIDSQNFNLKIINNGKKFFSIKGPAQNGGIKGRLRPLSELIKNFIMDYGVIPKIDKCVAGSLELALIAQIFGRPKGLRRYLVSDLTRFHASKRWGPIVKILETWLLKCGWVPCVTSPGFVRNYFASLGYQGKLILVNNVAFDAVWPDNFGIEVFNENRIEIVWCGLLRCRCSPKIIEKLVREANFINVTLAGTIETLEKDDRDILGCLDSVKYIGRYESKDLPNIYSNATYAWCCDWEPSGSNSESLLPNRLYQAISAGVPIIASSGSFVAMVVDYYGIGIVVPSVPDDAVEIILSIDSDKYKSMVRAIKNLRNYGSIDNGEWKSVLRGYGRVIGNIELNGGIFNV
jgi:glycosyltransferase involved in cell wall biosynthesis